MAENPENSTAWQYDEFESLVREGLYEKVKLLDQCAFAGAEQNVNGEYVKKPTVFLVPKGTRLRDWLERRCPGTHDHVDTMQANSKYIKEGRQY